MSGGAGSPIGAPLQAVGKGVSAASRAMDEQRRQQIAQMASQRILVQPTDQAGKKMYKEALALRTANPGIVGAQGGSSFQYAAPQPVQRMPGFGGILQGALGLDQGGAPGAPATYTVPGQPQTVRPLPGGPRNPADILALQGMRRDGMGGAQRTPAQARLAELLGR